MPAGGQLGLCHDLGRHQVEDQDAQRADVLAHGALLMHDKDIFLLQLVIGGQVFGMISGMGEDSLLTQNPGAAAVPARLDGTII